MLLSISCSTKVDAEVAEQQAKAVASVQPDTKQQAMPAVPSKDAPVLLQTMFRGNPARSGVSSFKGPRTAKPKWAFRTKGRIYADPAITHDGTILTASHDGFLYAVSADGKEKWSFNAEGKIWSTPAVAEDGTIYFGSDADKFYALSPDGKAKWTLSTEMPAEKKGEKIKESLWDVDTSPALGADGTIYFACHYYLYALRPDGELKWRFQAGLGRVKIFSSPALDSEGNIFFGTQGKRLFAVNASGKAIWNVETNGDNDSTPSVQKDTVFFGSDDNKVRALDTKTGELKWEAELGESIRAPITTGKNGVIYAATYSQKPFVEAIDANTGQSRWRFFIEPGDGAMYGIQSGILEDEEGYLYFGGRDGYVYCLTPQGKLQWRYKTGDQVDSGPVLDKNGTLYTGSDDKRLWAFER